MLAAAEEIGDPKLVEHALARGIHATLEMGDRPTFEAKLKRHGNSLEHHESGHHVYFHTSARAMQAILGGEFAEAERSLQPAMTPAPSRYFRPQNRVQAPPAAS